MCQAALVGVCDGGVTVCMAQSVHVAWLEPKLQ